MSWVRTCQLSSRKVTLWKSKTAVRGKLRKYLPGYFFSKILVGKKERISGAHGLGRLKFCHCLLSDQRWVSTSFCFTFHFKNGYNISEVIVLCQLFNGDLDVFGRRHRNNFYFILLHFIPLFFFCATCSTSKVSRRNPFISITFNW